MILHLLRPAESQKSIYEIDLDKLWQQGVRAVILDLDNTLVRWNDPEPTPRLISWLDTLRSKGFSICIVSNNGSRRVGGMADRLGVPYICHATKPRRSGFHRAMERCGVTPQETAVVGDQLFTDIFGGNRSGAYTILVTPIDTQEFFGTRFLRVIERMVMRYLARRGS